MRWFLCSAQEELVFVSLRPAERMECMIQIPWELCSICSKKSKKRILLSSNYAVTVLLIRISPSLKGDRTREIRFLISLDNWENCTLEISLETIRYLSMKRNSCYQQTPCKLFHLDYLQWETLIFQNFMRRTFPWTRSKISRLITRIPRLVILFSLMMNRNLLLEIDV